MTKMQTCALAALAFLPAVRADFVKTMGYGDSTCSGEVFTETASWNEDCDVGDGFGRWYRTTCINASAYVETEFANAQCTGAIVSTRVTRFDHCRFDEREKRFWTGSCLSGDYSPPRRPGILTTSFRIGGVTNCSAATWYL